MNPNELKKLKERAPLPLFILMVLFFLPTMMIEPQNEALNTAAASYAEVVRSARAAVNNRENFLDQSHRLQHLKNLREETGSLLPAEADLPVMIDRLQQLAGSAGVSLEEVRYEFNEEFDKLEVPSYRLQMNLRADYANMRNFLAAVENLDSPVIINEIVLIEGARYALTMRLLVK